MGNYKNIESDFIDRTMRLISQYYEVLDQYPYEEQFNYTLIINCLLGLIIMPNELVISYTPTSRLTNEFLTEMGIESSEIGTGINTLRALIKALRNSVAHFDINVLSEDERNHIDWLEFKDSENGGNLVAKFRSNELLPFLRYYSDCLLENLEKYQNQNSPNN